MTSPRSLLLSALALAAATLAAPAHAVGRLVDVQIIDRDSSATLPVYQHRGEWWVAGRPGARYAIQVRNAAPGRVLGVMAVDGVNVISGDTASWQQTGYVLSRGQSAQITGWRKSDDEVAAFHFTALPDSYAARTGRPDDVGVIGVAVFRERYVPPPPRASVAPAPPNGRFSAESAASAAAAPASPQADASARAPAPDARLGTGHGERETSYVTHTTFERRGSRPDEVITIRYDSRANLIAAGIIASPVQPPTPQPRPFPESTRYVPDPPAWR
ncbi:hypothetical protein [Ottowia testudinis]|uniref:Uncharacterized protein n=1 Tax=Ottowia testudinis TaxID=2816950 RepID=A0A975CHX9_9BURK|nr:hypothetical protein [Ottowia testudinis]QTD46510.1 hypothetical protein J1M35_06410 [Ottowia testudinis]